MFRSTFERLVRNMMLCAVLVGGTLTFATSVSAQTVTTTLSPASKQVLIVILRGAPPYIQRLILSAIQALGPARAEAQLAQVKTMPPQTLQITGQLVGQILRTLPQQYHQAFVNGLFEVTPAETQYATQLMTQAVTVQAAASAGIGIPPGVIGAQSAEAQAQMNAQIMASMNRIYELNNHTAQIAHETTQRIGDGWINVLGPARAPLVVYPY